MSINQFGYDERFWGSLAQWQTLNPVPGLHEIRSGQMYTGYELLNWHPYENLPRLPLDERRRSFSDRLAKAQARRVLQ